MATLAAATRRTPLILPVDNLSVGSSSPPLKSGQGTEVVLRRSARLYDCTQLTAMLSNQ